MMNKNGVVVEDLRVIRGKREVLKGLSLEILPGQVTGLLGPSGSGKSTLIRAIVGVQIVAGGTISVLGTPAGSASLRKRVAYATQTPSVYADLTIADNLRYFAKVLGAPKGAADAAHAHQLARNLSGGQLSRASLAVALVADPDVLVLDEPTVGLDPVLRRSLWDLFHKLADAGKTLLVSSHVMDEASRCDHLILLRQGEVLAEGSLQSICEATDTTDAESAFLALIDRAEVA